MSFLFSRKHVWWIYPLLTGLALVLGIVLASEFVHYYVTYKSPIIRGLFGVSNASFLWAIFKVNLIAGLVGGVVQWAYLGFYLRLNSLGKFPSSRLLPVLCVLSCALALWIKSFGMLFAGWGMAIIFALIVWGLIIVTWLQGETLENVFETPSGWGRAALLGVLLFLPIHIALSAVFSYFSWPQDQMLPFLTGIIFLVQGRVLSRRLKDNPGKGVFD